MFFLCIFINTFLTKICSLCPILTSINKCVWKLFFCKNMDTISKSLFQVSKFDILSHWYQNTSVRWTMLIKSQTSYEVVQLLTHLGLVITHMCAFAFWAWWLMQWLHHSCRNFLKEDLVWMGQEQNLTACWFCKKTQEYCLIVVTYYSRWHSDLVHFLVFPGKRWIP